MLKAFFAESIFKYTCILKKVKKKIKKKKFKKLYIKFNAKIIKENVNGHLKILVSC